MTNVNGFVLTSPGFLTFTFGMMYPACSQTSFDLRKPSTLMSKKTIPFLMVAIFAVSLSVRLYRLDGQTLECDELHHPGRNGSSIRLP